MATTESEYQVKWSGNDTVTLDGTTVLDSMSDALNLVGSSGATIVAAAITMKADWNTGTAADGDTVEFYLARSMGQANSDGGTTFDYPGGAGSDETVEVQHLATLDVFANDPAVKTVSLPVPLGKVKIWARHQNLTSTEDVVCSAVIRAILG